MVALKSWRGRGVLAATVLGSSIAFIDGTIINVALPHIGETFHAGLSGLTWAVNAYTLSLSALILLGGSLGDRFGRRRVFEIGAVWFALASLACGLAPTMTLFIVARALQGVGGALLTPGSLAILQSTFRGDERGRAIGTWSGLGGVAGAAGPFLGGWMVQSFSWRWALLINVPVGVVVVLLARAFVPESKDSNAAARLDLPGVALGVLGLAGVTYGLITAQDHGLGQPLALATFTGGLAVLIAFILRERVAPAPLLPLRLFKVPLFSVINGITFVVYGALGVVILWLVLALQIVAGFTPLQAGISLLPVTLVMMLLSARMGGLAHRIGPRWPMTLGLLLAAVGTFWMGSHIGEGARYFSNVFPGVLLMALGLSGIVAPLTTTVLAAAPEQHAGIASGVNNAFARVASLVAIAVIPLVTGLRGDDYQRAAKLLPAFHTAMLICTGMLLLSAGLTLALVRKDPRLTTVPF